MRGCDERTGALFSYVDLEARVRADHPLRLIRAVVDEALATLESEFAPLYARVGRPSIPPEKLLRAMLLQAFYSIRSERQLMERLEFDLLFGGPGEDPVLRRRAGGARLHLRGDRLQPRMPARAVASRALTEAMR